LAGIETSCENIRLALEKVRKETKSTDPFLRLFDEIYVDKVKEMATLKCVH